MNNEIDSLTLHIIDGVYKHEWVFPKEFEFLGSAKMYAETIRTTGQYRNYSAEIKLGDTVVAKTHLTPKKKLVWEDFPA